MCGIAGEITFQNNTQTNYSVFMEMQNLLKRRGPDQDGIYQSENCTLVHTRLAVIDPEFGMQPMKETYEDKEYCIVYNGELYNTKELKNRLKMLGYRFRSHSDTEVLLKCYMEWGEKCLPLLNGIFAFAVWEKHKKRLFFARDRMGVKPFFYASKDNTFIFGSEIKALLAHPQVHSHIDENSIFELFLLGPGRTPGYGVFKNISELCRGSYGFFDNAGLKIFKYWDLHDEEHTDSFEHTVEKVRFLVTDSIERQLVSDVPICTFLSGGLDSSIISTIASEYMKEKGEQLHTFSIDYTENDKYFQKSDFQPDSDNQYIGVMQLFLDSNHTVISIDTDDLINALYKAVDARDLPGMADVDSSLLLFCKKVKDFCTVALSGECADEIFGGYPWYRNKSVRESKGFPWSQSTGYRCGFLKDEFLQYANPSEYVFQRYRTTIENASKSAGTSKLEAEMKEMMTLNVDWFMQTLLDRKDRMSMYSGLEVRVPYCDHRIVEYLYTVPWDIKNYRDREKGLLRLAVEDLLPEEIVWRKKSPFPKTHHPLYLQKVSGLLKEIIHEPSSPLLMIAKKAELEKLLHSDSSIPWYGQLMTQAQTIAYFIQMNYWLEKYNVHIV